MDKTKLRQVMIDQQDIFKKTDGLVERDIELPLKGNEVLILSGIRRCGKSSLLQLISKRMPAPKLYINFDDVRLIDFSTENFEDVESIATELFGTDKITYFLDEVQNAKHWERWVNNLYANNKKVFVTGSNSRLLSSEISTFLTGRNRVIRLYPFSFREFLRLKEFTIESDMSSTKNSLAFRFFREYMDIGGFPQVIMQNDLELARQYFEDILNKDILTRHNIRQVKEIKDLLLFLFTNAGKPYSYSTLKQLTGIKSLSTINNYIDYFRDVFLLYTIDRFDYSLTKQKKSSSKPYAGDNSFLKVASFNFSENFGKRLENLVFIHLLRSNKEIYYHQGKKECDFLVKDGLKITQAIQVCLDMSNPATKIREIEGLQEAMVKYKLNSGILLTMEHEEILPGIVIKPVWRWMLE